MDNSVIRIVASVKKNQPKNPKPEGDPFGRQLSLGFQKVNFRHHY